MSGQKIDLNAALAYVLQQQQNIPLVVWIPINSFPFLTTNDLHSNYFERHYVAARNTKELLQEIGTYFDESKFLKAYIEH